MGGWGLNVPDSGHGGHLVEWGGGWSWGLEVSSLCHRAAGGLGGLGALQGSRSRCKTHGITLIGESLQDMQPSACPQHGHDRAVQRGDIQSSLKAQISSRASFIYRPTVLCFHMENDVMIQLQDPEGSLRCTSVCMWCVCVRVCTCPHLPSPPSVTSLLAGNV